jgi:nickel/cobalt transporter (NiCoT) family protein
MLLAFALGTRHGLDADHLAAIDGMVRCNVERRPGFSVRSVLCSL